MARGVETVLVVEDRRSVRELASEILRRSGYGVLEAADGGEALSVFERHSGPIHLVLTDMVMPGMNGRDLARRIQSLRPGTKILFMSGYAPGAGVAFIQKPVTLETLARKVRQTLDAPG